MRAGVGDGRTLGTGGVGWKGRACGCGWGGVVREGTVGGWGGEVVMGRPRRRMRCLSFPGSSYGGKGMGGQCRYFFYKYFFSFASGLGG